MLLFILLALVGAFIAVQQAGSTWQKGAAIGALVGAVIVLVVHVGPRKAPQCMSKAQGFGNLISVPFVKCRI